MADSRPFRSAPPAGAKVSDLIRFGAQEFERAGLCYGHGTDNPVDDAAALVFHVLDLDHDRAEEAYGLVPDAADVRRVLDTFAERIDRRVPAAYLMGRMWFAGLEFEVDDRVIVPRSPFAELIHAHFRPWIDPASRAQHSRYRHRFGVHRDRLRAGVPVGLGGRGRRVVAGARGRAPQRREARSR